MPTSRDNSEDLGRFRKDGVSSWAPQHVTAAECRARGWGWPDIAEETGYALSTVQDYTQIDGFNDLVEHFRQERRSEQLREHWRDGAVDALAALRGEVNSKRRARQRVEEMVVNGVISLEMVPGMINALTGDIIRASREYLRALGFTAAERERRKLQAQEEETGEAGDRLRLRQEKRDELEELDAQTLAELYEARFDD